MAAGDLRKVGEFNPYNGVASENCHVFLARGLRAAPAVGDPTEELEVHFLRPGTLETLIAENHIWDGMTLAAWLLVRGRVGAVSAIGGPEDGPVTL